MKIPRIPGVNIYDSSQAVDSAKEFIAKRRRGEIRGLKTQWTTLNRAIGGGWDRATQVIIGAQTSVGKSAFANIMVQSMLELNPDPIIVLYFNFEMSCKEQIIRNVSSKIGMTVQEIKSTESYLDDDTYYKITETADKLKEYNYVFVDTPMDKDMIEQVIRWYSEQYPACTIINLFDHTRLILSEKNQREMDMLDGVSGMGVRLKNELGTINIFISQLNREMMDNDRRRLGFEPENTHIFGSSRVAQDANTIMLLHRPELYNIEVYYKYPTENKMFIHLTKNRDGPVGMLVFNHNIGINQITE